MAKRKKPVRQGTTKAQRTPEKKARGKKPAAKRTTAKAKAQHTIKNPAAKGQLPKTADQMSLGVLESAKVRKSEDSLLVGETTSREKIAGQSKRRAREVLDIDRSQPDVTIKQHHVQEYADAGNPVGEPPEHRDVYPVKRRPRKLSPTTPTAPTSPDRPPPEPA